MAQKTTFSKAFSGEEARATLLRYFGYPAFRPGQEDIIASITEGNDTLVIMPTGGGKSLCYQVPALLCDGTALVISPLIALMKDQVDALERAGIPATLINSSLDAGEIRHRLQEARKGAYKLLYVAPERLESESFINEARGIPFSFLAVDEAHCISEWGHDFRPSYTRIAIGNEHLGRLPIIALTATATPEVQNDIVRSLQMQTLRRFTKGFNRPNLRYHVEYESQKAQRTAQLCADVKGSAVIYCGSRKRVEEFASSLRAEKIPAKAYHGGMKQEERRSIQDWFAETEQAVIVATNAFGMGVDKPNVRVVVHCDLPLTLEAYYQEAGRGGRDGAIAHCYVLYEQKDKGLPEFFLKCTYPEPEVLAKVYTYLFDATGTARGTKPLRPFMEDSVAIGNALGIHTLSVNSALSLFERQNIIRRGSTEGNATVEFTTSRDRLNDYFRHCKIDSRRKTLNALARLAGPEAFSRPIEFDFREMHLKHDIPPDQALADLRTLEYARLLRFQPPGVSGGITIMTERVPFEKAGIDLDALEKRRIFAFQKLDTVIRYVETPDCKRNFLLFYFQETDVEGTCGDCSSCSTTDRKKQMKTTRRQEQLIGLLLEGAAELNNRWGRTVLIDLLLGRRTEKIMKFNLHQAASFGKAATAGENALREALEYAIGAQLITVSADAYPTVQPSEEGYRRLGMHAPLPHTAALPQEHCSYPDLLAVCQDVRNDLSRREGLTPQGIIDDKSLILLVNALPSSVRKIKALTFLGDNVRSRYASAFAKAVAEFLSSETKDNPTASSLNEQQRKAVNLIETGLSFDEVAFALRITPSSLAKHCEKIIQAGVKLPRLSLVGDALYQEVVAILRLRPHETLKNVRLALTNDCSLPMLRVAIAFARREQHIELTVGEPTGVYGR